MRLSFSKKKMIEKIEAEAPQGPPVHLVDLILTKHWQLIPRIIEDFPEEASRPIVVNDMGRECVRLPLHEVCRSKPPFDVVDALIKTYPEALRSQETVHHFTPLHFACRYGASSEVIQRLTEASPASVSLKDKFGNTPMMLTRRSSQPNRGSILELLENFQLEELDHEDIEPQQLSSSAA